MAQYGMMYYSVTKEEIIYEMKTFLMVLVQIHAIANNC